MKATLTSARKAQQTIEITFSTASVIRCRANKDFRVNTLEVKAGDEFFLVRSERQQGRYHVVRWAYERVSWVCSCGACTKKHSHLHAVNTWVYENRVERPRSPYVRLQPTQKPVKPMAASPVQGMSETERHMAARGLMRGNRHGGMLSRSA
jgi:hypothetical protein